MADTKTPAQAKSAKPSDEPAGVDFDSLRAGVCKFPLGGIDGLGCNSRLGESSSSQKDQQQSSMDSG